MKTGFNRRLQALSGGFGRKKNQTLEEPCGRRRGIAARIRYFCFGREEGNSLVEFALTLPILMAVLVAIFEFGIAFNNQLTLTQAVGTASQYLQTIRQSTSDPCQDTFTAIKNSAPTLNPANITLKLTMSGNTPVTATSCSGDQTELTLGQPTTVYASYPCNITIFGIGLGGMNTRNFGCNLTAQVTVYEN